MTVDAQSPSPPAGEGLGRGGRRDSVALAKPAPTTTTLLIRAKAMRSAQTDAELKLWQILRGKRLAGFKFKRQVPIDRYIADFVCFAHRLIIEADGSQHVGSTYDAVRDRYLCGEGFTVLRFSNYDILTNDEGVAEIILGDLNGDEQAIEACSSLPLSPTPLPQGERG